jgi:hypothetical protein
MNPTTAQRFDAEFAPRIAQAIRSVIGPKVDVQLQATAVLTARPH